MTTSGAWLGLLAAAAGLWWLLWYVYPAPVARLAQWAERRQGHLVSRRYRHAGIDWHCLEGGHGPVLVLLHGFNGDAHHFARTARHLHQHFRIMAPDIPGFGETQVDGPISHRIEDIAKRILSWLDDQHIDAFYVGGNSMGGYIAAAMAQAAPDRVTGLWLLAPGGVRQAPLSPVLQEVAEDRHNPLLARDFKEFQLLLDYCFVRRPWVPAPLLRYLAKLAGHNAARGVEIFDAMLHESRPLEDLTDGLNTPCLIYWGAQDRVLHPDGADIIANRMPNAQAIVVPNIGHLPMLESPRASAEAWLSFTEQLARGQHAASR